MKVVILVFIACIAGLMVYLWRQPVCANGSMFQDEVECAASGAFDAGFCRRAFADSEALARSGGTVYRDRIRCENGGTICLSHLTIPGGWVHRPAAWCLANHDGAPSLEPIYSGR